MMKISKFLPGVRRGFTLIEILTSMSIAAIGVALAVPSFTNAIERRQLSAGAEEIGTFLSYAQSEAIKRNEQVTVSWYTPGGHSTAWCVGVTEGGTACDCRETVASEADFCAINDIPYHLQQTDFVDINYEFMHMNPAVGSFSFDPVRGIMTNISSNEIIDDDYLFYVHSNDGSGSTRDYELEVRVGITGRVKICADTSRRSIIGGYEEC
jgi:type IV fimbrial biogenesis protein FimT